MLSSCSWSGGVSPDSYPNASLPGNLDSVPLDDTTYGQPWLEIDKKQGFGKTSHTVSPCRCDFCGCCSNWRVVATWRAGEIFLALYVPLVMGPHVILPARLDRS